MKKEKNVVSEVQPEATKSEITKYEVLGFEIAQMEYCEFHNSMIEHSASDVYDNALKITAIKAFHDCIEAKRDNEVVGQILVAFCKSELSYEILFNEFLRCDFNIIEFYSDTIKFFNYVLNE